MEIKVTRLELNNFCGAKDLDVKFFDRTIVKGVNGVCKTTIAHGICWILADKMADGSSPDSIRPKDENGNDIDYIDIEGTLTLTIDGTEYTLKKKNVQDWVKDKTTQESRFRGNNNLFEINGIAKKRTDYEAFISQFIDIDLLLLCMNPNFFLLMDNKKRRNALFGLGDDIDEELFASDERFEELRSQLEVGNIYEIMASVKRSINAQKDKLDEIPARIDEQSKELIYLSDEEVADLNQKISDAESRLAEISTIESSQSDITKEISECKARMVTIQNEINLANQKASAESGFAEQKLVQELALLRGSLPQYESRIKEAKSRISDHESMVKVYKNSIEEIKAETFNDADLRCPVCGSKYTKAKLSELKDKWQDEQDKKILDNEHQCQDCEVRIEEIKKNIAGWESEITAKQTEIEAKEKELAGLDKAEFVPAKIEDNAEYITLTETVKQLEESKATTLIDTGAEKQQLTVALTGYKAKLLSPNLNKAKETRIAELQAERLKVSQEIANNEKYLDLLKDYERAKIDLITKSINKYFKVIKWRFFRPQINGSYQEVCEGLVNGVSMDKLLNHGDRLLANLDLCEAYQRKAGVTVPLILDDSESIDSWRIPKRDGQLIVLRRTDDPTLVVESLA